MYSIGTKFNSTTRTRYTLSICESNIEFRTTLRGNK